MPDRAGGGRSRSRGAPNACTSDRAKRPRKAAPDAAAAPRRKSRRLIVIIPPRGRITPHPVETPPQPRVLLEARWLDRRAARDAVRSRRTFAAACASREGRARLQVWRRGGLRARSPRRLLPIGIRRGRAVGARLRRPREFEL